METSFEQQVAEALSPHLPALLEHAPGSSAPADALLSDLARFCGALARANRRINLTGIVDPRDMAVRHVLDALLALPTCGGQSVLVDLGSGCGVPGIPLALALPERPVVLIESRLRKADALARLVDELGLAPRVSAVRARGETWLAQAPWVPYSVVTRAVGSIAMQLRLLRRVRDRLDRLVLLKGPAVDRELAEAAKELGAGGWPRPGLTQHELPDDAGRRTLVSFELSPPATPGTRNPSA